MRQTAERAPAQQRTAESVSRRPAGPVQRLQTALRVSQSHDPAEREAEATSRRVMGMAGPAPAWNSSQPAAVMRLGPAAGPATAPSEVESGITAAAGGGQSLPADLRAFMEPRFGADFRAVRIHTDARAARLSRRLNARAFTVGRDIFFAEGAYQPTTSEGAELIAHELTHTIQQSATVQRAEAAPVAVRQDVGVQRLGISDALDYFADKATIIPGFRLFTILLGVNPINMRRADRSAANILRALIELIPGGALIVQALEAHGVFATAGAWVERQMASLGMAAATIRGALDRFLDQLGWRDIFRLSDVWSRAKRLFEEPIDRMISFGRSLADGIVRLVKDAILMPLARLASATRGWDLLCAVLGRNPITGEVVPRTADTLIGGFMKLIGQEEVWNDIKRANAVSRAWAWFQGALAGVLSFVAAFPQMFIATLRALTVADIILLPRALARVAGAFGNFVGRFLSWAGEQVMSLLEIIFEVVAPGVMVYIRRAASAFRTIIRAPVRFLGNLVRAGVQGFRQFAGNFLTHLRTSLIGWITGAMSGASIYIPQSFSLSEMIKFILSVLGLTWQNIRTKLVRAIGEPAVAVLERTFDIVMTLVREGPSAAWQRIVESIGNLRDMVMEQVMSFVQSTIVQAAITKLLTSLNPVGAFVQAVIAIYNTVMFFVERLRQIGQVAAAVIDSLAAIANGVIAAAANKVEQTAGGLLTLVISFLARLVGLGRVSDAVTNVINRVRRPVDRALERVVEWIVAQARRLGMGVAEGARRVLQWWRARRAFRQGGRQHTLHFTGSDERSAVLSVSSRTVTIRVYITEQVVPNVPASHPKRGNIAVIHSHVDRIEVLKQGSYGQAAGSEITDRFNAIAQLLAELGDAVPETAKPDHKSAPRGSSRDVGEKVRVETLTRSPGQNSGSAPFEVTPLWNAVNRRPNTYVRGHLLNHHLFGAGKNVNLVPITRSLNSRMSAKFEEPVKREIFEKGAIMSYEVTFIFGARSGTRTIMEENLLPTAVTGIAKKKDPETGQFAVFKDLNESHELPPDGPLTGARPRLVRLSLASPQAGPGFPAKNVALNELHGVGPVRAAILAGLPAGYLATWADLDRLSTDALHNPSRIPFTGLAASWQQQTSEVTGARLVYLNGATVWQY